MDDLPEFINLIIPQAIVGGNYALPGDLPYQVFLTHTHLSHSGQFLCGGAILTPLLILTAAHCLTNTTLSSIRIIAGTTDRTLPQDNPITDQIRFARSIYSHENYSSSTSEHDIALVELSSPLEWTEYVDKVILPEKDEEFSSFITVSGWGHTEEEGELSTHLNKVNLPLLSNEECGRGWTHRERVITDNMICSSSVQEGSDACKGDSGGPGICRRVDPGESSTRVLCGIVSFGDGCGQSGIPGVYTRVANYIDWISATIEKINNRTANGDLNDREFDSFEDEIEAFIDGTSDINRRYGQGKTFLHLIAEVGDAEWAIENALYLIDHGADIFAKDNKNNTFLHTLLSSKMNHITPTEFHNLVLNLLGRKLRAVFNIGGGPLQATPVHLAVTKLEVGEATLSLLSSNKVDLNALDVNGDNLLSYAIMGQRKLTLMEDLIQLGVNWRNLNKQGQSLLHIAAKYWNLQAVKFLIEKGLDANLRDVQGQIPFGKLLQSGLRNVLFSGSLPIVRGGRSRWKKWVGRGKASRRGHIKAMQTYLDKQ